MTSIIKMAGIPTLSQLYRSGKVAISSSDEIKGNQAHNDKICMLRYDITQLHVDAIVNAANRTLLGGGGVDFAIHEAAGPGLLKECETLGGCGTGSAKITDAYELPCNKVIHAVGPKLTKSTALIKAEPLLRSCYKISLQLAADNGCRTIAFPSISTGVYGYPLDPAAFAALDEVKDFLEQPDGQKIDKVVFCCFANKDVDAYKKALPNVFPASEEDRKAKAQTIRNPSDEAREQDRIEICQGPPSKVDHPSISSTTYQKTMVQEQDHAVANHRVERLLSRPERIGENNDSEKADHDVSVNATDTWENKPQVGGVVQRAPCEGSSRPVRFVAGQRGLEFYKKSQEVPGGKGCTPNAVTAGVIGMAVSGDVIGETDVDIVPHLVEYDPVNEDEPLVSTIRHDNDSGSLQESHLQDGVEEQDCYDFLAEKLDGLSISIQECGDSTDVEEVAR